MVPLLAYARRHYVRVYAKVMKSVSSADKSMQELGFITHCRHCSYRAWVFGLAPVISGICPVCGSRIVATGPLWLGRLHDQAFIGSVLSELIDRESGKHAVKLVEMCMGEIDVPTFYDQHKICRALKIPPIRIDAVVDKLRDSGFAASKTHFSGTSFKTDADIRAIAGILSKGR